MRQAVLTCVTFLLLVCGCTSVTAETPPSPPVVQVSPAFDARRARTDRGLVVRALGGTLSRVVVSEGGEQVPGRLDDSRTIWRSNWTLKPAAEYTVTATATGARGP
ncbi:Ig-like domain-containing protein, partial [Nonomuraea sp. NPDC049784]|uniref:Ig-like domain-containing protein n=1 Tax=Nonomuraea sp. NPDC049784 TaxID=3154361 RepID=UPI0033E655A1